MATRVPAAFTPYLVFGVLGWTLRKQPHGGKNEWGKLSVTGSESTQGVPVMTSASSIRLPFKGTDGYFVLPFVFSFIFYCNFYCFPLLLKVGRVNKDVVYFNRWRAARHHGLFCSDFFLSSLMKASVRWKWVVIAWCVSSYGVKGLKEDLWVDFIRRVIYYDSAPFSSL